MLDQKQNPTICDWRFLEVWADTTASPPYILMLLNNNSGLWHVVDPVEGYRIWFSSESYEEAKLWLLEDEYECVRGRLVNEDPNDG